ncbi:MAG: ornithine carbamoyltransferase [Pseudomonadota bacterium]
MTNLPRHFLGLDHLSGDELQQILALAARIKARRLRGSGLVSDCLQGRSLACIFDKPSTRTRVSFDCAMNLLGGHALTLLGADLQIGRGETLGDTARVLSGYVDAIMFRTHSHSRLEELSAAARIPVINGLTDFSHPCQIVADLMTIIERFGTLAGQKIAWVGDGNNVAASWIHASASAGFELAIGCPESLMPDPSLLQWAADHGARVTLFEQCQAAVDGASVVVTDTWVSMGDPDSESRHNLLRPYQVDQALMAVAERDAIFMHCLPAHRGEEVSAEVIDGPQSVVWQEAENRLYAQMAILIWCILQRTSLD